MIHEFGYNEGQARDPDGKWASGGGSSSGGDPMNPSDANQSKQLDQVKSLYRGYSDMKDELTDARANYKEAASAHDRALKSMATVGPRYMGLATEDKVAAALREVSRYESYTQNAKTAYDIHKGAYEKQYGKLPANAEQDFRFAYNPDQARDPDGKWASGGGGGSSSDSSGGQASSGGSSDSPAVAAAASAFDKVANRLQSAEEEFKKVVWAPPNKDYNSPEYKAHEAVLRGLRKQINRDEYRLMDAAMKLHAAKGGAVPDIKAASEASTPGNSARPLSEAMQGRKDIMQSLLDERAARTGQSYKWLPKSWVASSDSEPHKFASITGAEVFATGSWNGLDFSESDLDGIASSFDAMQLAGRVPLKFGHSGADARDGAPALGWVDRVYRDGNKLMADFSSIPNVVYDAIKEGMYKFVSVELLKNVPANTRNIPWVLDAVALLGASQPAVGILKDLQTLTMSRGTGLRGAERVAFRRNFSQSGDHNMSDDIRSVHEQLRVLMGRVEAAEMRASSAETQLKSDKINTKRHELKALFERAIQAREIVPAIRESFTKVYRTDDDDFLERLNLDDARSFIKANSTTKQESVMMSRQHSDDTTGTNAEVVTSMAQRENVSRGYKADDAMALVESTKALFRRNPALAAAYFNEPDAAFKSEV